MLPPYSPYSPPPHTLYRPSSPSDEHVISQLNTLMSVMAPHMENTYNAVGVRELWANGRALSAYYRAVMTGGWLDDDGASFDFISPVLKRLQSYGRGADAKETARSILADYGPGMCRCCCLPESFHYPWDEWRSLIRSSTGNPEFSEACFDSQVTDKYALLIPPQRMWLYTTSTGAGHHGPTLDQNVFWREIEGRAKHITDRWRSRRSASKPNHPDEPCLFPSHGTVEWAFNGPGVDTMTVRRLGSWVRDYRLLKFDLDRHQRKDVSLTLYMLSPAQYDSHIQPHEYTPWPDLVLSEWSAAMEKYAT